MHVAHFTSSNPDCISLARKVISRRPTCRRSCAAKKSVLVVAEKSKSNKKDIVEPEAGQLRKWGMSRGVKYFLICFTDLFGVARSKLVPTAAMNEAERNGASFAAFATYLDFVPSDPDMVAMPDAACAVQLPWKPEVAWVPADPYCRGMPVAHAPRNVLKAQMKRAAAMGFVPKTGVEVEFFVLDPKAAGPADKLDDASKPCYDQQALMRRYDLIAQVCGYMGDLGWGPYQNDHEDANGQFEMNWGYDSALVTADRHDFFKFMLRSCAEAAGLRVTFMPKPFANRTGNGCHTHVSVWGADGSARAGENLFLDPSADLGISKLATHFLGGVMRSAEGLCALTNPTVNSYKRLNARSTRSGATWSPISISWTGNNRTHMIRVPDAGRFEFRLPDGTANPYLLQAGIVAAGLSGMETRADPGPRIDANFFEEKPPPGIASVPSNLLDAIRALKADTVLRDGLGVEFIEAYSKLKLQSWLDFNASISQWELDTTLDA